MQSVFCPMLHLAPSPPKLLHLFLDRSSPCLLRSASFSLPWWCPSHGYPWDGTWVHSTHMSNPHPPSELDDTWQWGQARSSVKIFIGDCHGPENPQYSPKASSLEYIQLVTDSLCHFPRLSSIQENPEDVALKYAQFGFYTDIGVISIFFLWTTVLH